MSDMWKKLFISCLAAVLVVLLTEAAVFAAPARPAPDVIGIIDPQFVMTKHPDFEKISNQVRQMMEQKMGEGQNAIEKEPDQAKKAQIHQTKLMEMRVEEQRLMEPIARDCQEAIRVIAKQRNVTIVLDKAAVLFGGQDITDYVVQQLGRR